MWQNVRPLASFENVYKYFSLNLWWATVYICYINCTKPSGQLFFSKLASKEQEKHG